MKDDLGILIKAVEQKFAQNHRENLKTRGNQQDREKIQQKLDREGHYKRIDNIAGQDNVKHDICQAAPTLRGNQLLFSGHHTGYNQNKQHSLQIKQLSHSSAHSFSLLLSKTL